jgi:Tfp pilus assembly protein PilN
VRASLSAGGISASEAVTIVPRRLVTLKNARLPAAGAEQIAAMVQFEAQDYIPFPIEEVVIGHQILETETDDMATVLVAAARRSLIEDLLAIFDKAGVEITSITVSSLALAAHVRRTTVPTAVLEVSDTGMDIAVANAERMLFSRSAVLEPDGATLLEEVSRSLTAYQNEFRALPVSEVKVAGSPRSAEAAAQTLSSALPVPVSLLGAGTPDPELSLWAVAVGAGFLFGSGEPGVNLVPASRAERKVQARRRVQNTAAAGVAAAAVAAILYFAWMGIAAQNRERTAAVRENRKLESMDKKLKAVKTQHAEVLRTYRTVAAGLARHEGTVDVLKYVSDAIPKTAPVFLTQIAVDRAGNVAIQGNAQTESAATELVLALQASRNFAEARLTYIGDAQTEEAASAAPGATTKKRVSAFIVACRLKPGPIDASTKTASEKVETASRKEVKP